MWPPPIKYLNDIGVVFDGLFVDIIIVTITTGWTTLRPVASLDAAVDVLDNGRFRNLTVRRLTFCKARSCLAVRAYNRQLSHRAWFHMTSREFHFRAQCDNESQSREQWRTQEFCSGGGGGFSKLS
jgi:hypothetical protein